MDTIISSRDNSITYLNVVKAKKGDNEAFGALIHINKLSMYRISKSILKNEHDVEDAIGETILKAYKNISHLKNNDIFKSWLFKILVNECYSAIKKKKREILTTEFDNCDNTYEDNYKDFKLMNAINSLEENKRIATILFYYEDMSISMISKTLGIPEGTVKSRLSRAKENLKVLVVNL
ncbi:RNA polymerase sigma factor [Clostridium sp.]|jgi:RNA polymerase sigma-70 factor (ECF subfamily)|uniref:RNA polymerase sigma factor n=1 Tax=Clostridium sp. TaxID=1506 RepID=UPI003EE844C4